jgi:phosphotriesterase-related protein
VRTVTGDIDPGDVGITLIHEHLHMDATPMLAGHGYAADEEATVPFTPAHAAECRWNPGAHPGNYAFTEVDAVVEDLVDARDLGVAIVVDATPIDLGRSPSRLVALAQATGLGIVMGTGYYLSASHRAVLPAGSEEDTTYRRIVDEHENGVDGVRPGLIGEIGTGHPPDTSELAVLKGAARAAVDTGLVLSVHVHPWGDGGHAAMSAITGTGLAPSRVILHHMNTAIDSPDYLRDLLATGAHLAFDLFGFDHSLLGAGRYPPSDADCADAIARLVDAGWVHRIVLSQDIGVRTRLRRYGGWGYGHLLRHVVPLLRARGLDDDTIRTLLVDNPARLLTLEETASSPSGDP